MRVLHLHGPAALPHEIRRSAALVAALPGADHVLAGAGWANAERPRRARFDATFPPLSGKPSPGRLGALAKAMRGFDLVLSHGWETIDAALAHTLLRDIERLGALVHHEYTLGTEGRVRALYRRVALGRAGALVVGDAASEAAALGPWQQPPARVHRVGPGVDLAAHAHRARPDALPRVVKRKGELWLGTQAPANGEPALAALLEAFAVIGDEAWQLVVLGDELPVPARERLRDRAVALGLAHRLHMAGGVAEPARVLPLFDLYAPLAGLGEGDAEVLGAMASGLAVSGAPLPGLLATLSPENAEHLAATGGLSLRALAADKGLRARLGKANHARAAAAFDESARIAALLRLYAGVLGLERLA